MTSDKRKRPALRGKLGGSKKPNQTYSNSGSSQRAILLKHFATCPRLSTMEARDLYGILHPSGRIMELRKRGYRIETIRISAADFNGVIHRIGQYVFHGKEGAANAGNS